AAGALAVDVDVLEADAMAKPEFVEVGEGDRVSVLLRRGRAVDVGDVEVVVAYRDAVLAQAVREQRVPGIEEALGAVAARDGAAGETLDDQLHPGKRGQRRTHLAVARGPYAGRAEVGQIVEVAEPELGDVVRVGEGGACVDRRPAVALAELGLLFTRRR